MASLALSMMFVQTCDSYRAQEGRHLKFKEVMHRDFADCSTLAETLSGQDAGIFCLGAAAAENFRELHRVGTHSCPETEDQRV